MAKVKGPTTFTVEGMYSFPVDMLRYDACWPATTDDTIQLGASITRLRGDNKLRRVTLRTNSENRPTEGRWNSFGWRVVS